MYIKTHIIDIHKKGIITHINVCIHAYKNSNNCMYTQTYSQFLFEVIRVSIHGEIF